MCWSVARSVRKVYCGKMAEWIRAPFGVVRGVRRETRILDKGGYCHLSKAKVSSFRGEPRASHCNQRGHCGVVVGNFTLHVFVHRESKKGDTILLSISLLNIDRFS